MNLYIKEQRTRHQIYFLIFGVVTLVIMLYYLSNTLFYFTTPRQFPINSFERFPLTFLILPAEIFSFLFALYFVYVLIDDRYRPAKPSTLKNKPDTTIAVLIPVYNEPKDIVDRTLEACDNLRWPGKVKIYLLDDSTDSEDKRNMAVLAEKYGAKLIRRPDRVGFKAGNINNAVKNYVKEDFFVVFDSDQAPEPEFLEETMDYFSDKNVGLVQTPQHFINASTPLERAAKVGNDIFYRAQCVSKAKAGAIPYCGTNLVVRTDVFKRVKGFAYYTATEDIELGIRINEIGYRGEFVPKILVHGYVPKDFKSYSSQQYRWANGNLAILRQNFLKFIGGNFPLRYRIHMFFTIGWWLIGLVTLLYIMVPILSLIFGIGTHHSWLPSIVLFFLPVHVILGIGMIYVSTSNRVETDKVRFSDALLQYSLIVNSMFIYARAAINAIIFKRYIGFVRTSKKADSAGLWQIKWNLLLGTVAFALSLYALYYGALSTSVEQVRTYIPISLWLMFYALVLMSSIIFVGKVEGGKK